MAADKDSSVFSSLRSFLPSYRRFFKPHKQVEHGRRHWDKLGADMMEKITSGLDVKSVASVKSVCKSWQTLLTQPGLIRTPPKNPWLLLPQSSSFTTVNFYDMFGTGNNIYSINVPEPLHGGRVCGCSKGWLAVAKESGRIFLFDPLSGVHHELPSLIRFHDLFNEEVKERRFQANPCTFVNRIELSSANLSECVVAAIVGFSHIVICCRPKDKYWTRFDDPRPEPYYETIAFGYETLYVVGAGRGDRFGLKKDSRVPLQSFTMKLDTGNKLDHGNDDVRVINVKLLPWFRENLAERRYGDITVLEGLVTTYLVESGKHEHGLFMIRKFTDVTYEREDAHAGNRIEEVPEDAPNHDGIAAIEDLEIENVHGHHEIGVVEPEYENHDDVIAMEEPGGGIEPNDEDEIGSDDDDSEEEEDLEGREVVMVVLVDNKVSGFEVFELIPNKDGGDDDQSVKSFSAKSVDNLGDRQGVVFVGRGSSFVHSFDASKEGNRIYHTDDKEGCNWTPSSDTGVFQIGEGELKQCLPCIDLPRGSYMYWFTPNLSF